MSTVPPTDRLGASRAFGIAFVLLAAVGLFFSGLLLHDELTLRANPDFVPACSVNSVISCTDVMSSPQASVFGFSNPVLGVIGFSLLLIFGLLLLFGVRFPRWVWAGVLVGLIFAVVFVHWMAYQAAFVIVALCVYCMMVWIVTLPMFLMALVYLARDRAARKGKPVGQGVGQPAIVLVAWYLGFAALVAQGLFL